VYACYAGADGGLHPAVQARAARIGLVPLTFRQRLAAGLPPAAGRRPAAGQQPAAGRRRPAAAWRALREALEQEVAGRVQATIAGRHVPPRIQPRLLTAGDLPPGEQEHLTGSYGAFLTAQARAQRPRLLGLYPGPVLDEPADEQQWAQQHPAYPHYAMGIVPRSRGESLMSAEGYAGAAAFANTRLAQGPRGLEIDRTATGINALFVPFEVNLTLPPSPGHPGGPEPTRWQPLVALIALDNLYADHNPGGMIIADYGENYLPLFHPVKPEPGTPPA
jgi:hypothetical protein